MKILPYDRTSKESIEIYAQKLKGLSFKNVLDNDPNLTNEDKAILYEYYNNPRCKGNLGNLIEEHYFFYKPNGKQEADFNEAGIELKVTPYLINKNKELRAKERLVLTMIDYMEDYKDNFESSHMYSKCALMLLVFYLYETEKIKLDYFMNYIKLFEFPENDLEIIKNDYYTIIEKIKQGKAHEISEGDTNYLGACTKGANASSVRKQPFNEQVAPQRAFCLKQSYMSYILNKYISNDNVEYEPVVKNSTILKKETLETYIINKLSKYYRENVETLRSKFNITSTISNKSFTYDLAKGMLEVLNDKIEEFEKANIKIKAIRLNKNGVPEEHMSFPNFKYTEIINEDWESSELYEMFSTTKYLFIVYQYTDKNTLIFKKAKFWNIPAKDINSEIRRVWEETVKKIKNNEYNDLPKTTGSPILHVRPHGKNSKDTYPTPDGNFAVKKCFWLHKNYIKEQIESED